MPSSSAATSASARAASGSSSSTSAPSRRWRRASTAPSRASHRRSRAVDAIGNEVLDLGQGQRRGEEDPRPAVAVEIGDGEEIRVGERIVSGSTAPRPLARRNWPAARAAAAMRSG